MTADSIKKWGFFYQSYSLVSLINIVIIINVNKNTWRYIKNPFKMSFTFLTGINLLFDESFLFIIKVIKIIIYY